MGRPTLSRKDVTVKTTLRFTRGLLARIRAVAGENQVADFVREAVERELARREKRTPRKGATDDEQT